MLSCFTNLRKGLNKIIIMYVFTVIPLRKHPYIYTLERVAALLKHRKQCKPLTYRRWKTFHVKM